MTGKTYSAGTIFLQVVPVFGDTMNAIKREARDVNDALAAETSKSLEKAVDEGSKRGADRMEENLSKGAERGGDKAGKKYAGAFITQLRSAVRDAGREVDAIKLRTDDEDVKKSLANLRKEMRSINRTKIKPDMDIDALLRRVAAAKAAIEELNKTGKVDVDFNFAKMQRDLARIDKMVESLKPKVEVEVDTKKADRQLSVFERKFKDHMSRAAKGFGDDVSGEIARIQARMQALSDAHIGVDLDAGQAIAEAAALQVALERLAATGQLDESVTINATAARAELIAIQELANKIDGRTLRIKADADVAAASAKMSLLQRMFSKSSASSDGAANSFRAFNIVILAVAAGLPILVPLLAAVGGGLLALLPILASVGSGLGVMMIGFSGLGNAITQLGNVQKNAKKDALAMAKTERTAARSVADAHRALANARVDAGRRQADAARAVAEAERSSAQQIKSALQAQADAERSLADAQRDATQAQKDLREARAQAQKDLEKVADRQRQNLLDIRQAQIDLFNATNENNAAQADPASTRLEREQASINLGNAQERLHGLRDEQKALNAERKKGVDGNDQVKAAEDAVASALRARADAARNLARAEAAVNQARLDGARQVSDALRNQARAQDDSARSIADAKRNLTQAESDYKDALVQTGEVGSSSMLNLRDAMSKLGPEGRHFARFIFGLRDEFYGIRRAIQEAMLPGVEQGIRALMRHEAGVKDFAKRMAGVVGGLFRHLGRMMSNNPAFTGFFDMIDRLGPRFTRQFGKGVIDWLGIFARLATITAPWAKKLSDALLAMSDNVLKFLNSKKGTKVIQDFMGYVARIGPKVWRLFLALVAAFLNLAEALAPIGEVLLEGVTNALEFIASMDPKKLRLIAGVILVLVVTFQTLVGIVAIASGGAALFAAMLAGGPLAILLGLVAALMLAGGAFLVLWHTSDKFRTAVTKIFHAIGDVVTWLFERVWKPYFTFILDIVKRVWKDIVDIWKTSAQPMFAEIGGTLLDLWTRFFKPVFDFIWSIVKAVFRGIAWAWDHILWPVIDTFGRVIWKLWVAYIKVVFKSIEWAWKVMVAAVKWQWEHVLKPVFDLFMWIIGDRLVNAFKTAIDDIQKLWDNLKGIIAAPIKFVIEKVINGGLIDAFNWVARKVGGTEIKYVPVPDWADSNNGKVTSPHGGHQAPDLSAATGAVVPGYTPGRDVAYAHVSGGEAIMRPEWTRGVGEKIVNYWNYIARTKGAKGVQEAMMGGFRGAFANGGVVWPTVGRRVSTYAGHDGVDINQPPGPDFGAPIYAYRKGKIVYVGWNHGYGDAIFEKPDVGPTVVYGHGSKVFVRAGQSVSAGQIIGLVGDTGNAEGAHLHFGIPGGTYEQALALLHGATAVGGGAGFDAGGGFKLPGWASDILGGAKDWITGKIKDAAGSTLDKFAQWGEIALDTALHLAGDVGSKIHDMVSGWAPHIGGSPDAMLAGISGGSAAKIVQAVASKFGWGQGSEWAALQQIVSHESSWNPTAQNGSSTAYGLFQFLDGTWAGTGIAKTSDPAKQALAGMRYIKARYGDPIGAWNFWQANGSYAKGGVVPDNPGPGDNGTMMYDNGGYLPPGMTTVLNLTGKPEPVFTADQFAKLGSGGSGLHYEPHFYESDLTASDVTDDLEFAFRRHGFGGKYDGGGQ